MHNRYKLFTGHEIVGGLGPTARTAYIAPPDLPNLPDDQPEGYVEFSTGFKAGGAHRIFAVGEKVSPSLLLYGLVYFT